MVIIKISFLLIKESAPINNIIKIRCNICDLLNLDTMNATNRKIIIQITVLRCSSLLATVEVRCVKYYQVSIFNMEKY